MAQKTALEAVPGDTPLVEVDGVFAKLECANPCGSIKDRITHFIINQSEKLGLLKPGMTLIEATSGNTGIAFSYYGTRSGYKVKIVMPRNMTQERQDLIRSLGAELILCEEGNFLAAAEIRDRLAEEHGYFNPDQFSNPLNVECHLRHTGQELISQMVRRGKSIEAFVAGVGTGGTLMGVGQALRKLRPNTATFAVEPSESAVMSGKPPGIHQIYGIGDGFIPAIASDGKGGVHPDITGVIAVSSEEAKQAAHYLREQCNLCVGISSGANFVAAKQLQKRYTNVATVFSDGFERYQTHGLKYSGSGRCAFEEERHSVIHAAPPSGKKQH